MAFDKIVDHLVAAGHGSRKRCRVKARSLIDAFDQLGTTAELLEQFGDDAADDVDVPEGLIIVLGGGAFQAWRRWSDDRKIRKHLRN